jgi:hypothetical protein
LLSIPDLSWDHLKATKLGHNQVVLIVLQVATSGFASIARLPFGVDCNVLRAGGQPPQLLRLYEYELSPFCRRVREAITDLDLNVEIYPCPWGAQRTRAVMEVNVS